MKVLSLVAFVEASGHGHGRSHVAGTVILVVAAVTVVLLAVGLASPRLRPLIFRAAFWVAAIGVALYLVIRGIAEFWVVDYGNPASYRQSWGGPSLLGVFAVHTGPAVVVVVGFGAWLWRRRTRRSPLAAGRTRESMPS